MIHLRMRTCKDREIIVVKARCVMTPGFYEKKYSTIMHINGNIYAGEDYQGEFISLWREAPNTNFRCPSQKED